MTLKSLILDEFVAMLLASHPTLDTLYLLPNGDPKPTRLSHSCHLVVWNPHFTPWRLGVATTPPFKDSRKSVLLDATPARSPFSPLPAEHTFQGLWFDP